MGCAWGGESQRDHAEFGSAGERGNSVSGGGLPSAYVRSEPEFDDDRAVSLAVGRATEWRRCSRRLATTASGFSGVASASGLSDGGVWENALGTDEDNPLDSRI